CQEGNRCKLWQNKRNDTRNRNSSCGFLVFISGVMRTREHFNIILSFILEGAFSFGPEPEAIRDAISMD
ncbi:hypothetical protein, partial [Salmonella enterica]|uniref:hypothetical protein n=1 Tax=Salmonella enterica TaxID=28901 RepID=UPI000A78E6D0